MKKSVALMIVFCLFMIGCSATEKINEKIVPEMEESKGNDVDNSKVESSIAETSQAISTEENGSYFTLSLITSEEEGELFTFNGIEHEDFWSEENFLYHQDESCPLTMDIKVNGVDYSGVYQYSIIKRHQSYQSDCYRDEEKKTEFEIKHGTEEVTVIEIMSGRIEGDVDYEQAEEIASDFASQYINTDEYALYVRPYTDDDIFYVFTFYRPNTINGVGITGGVYVEVGVDGNIYMFREDMVDEIDNFFEAYGEERLKNVVESLVADEVAEKIKDELKLDGYSSIEEIRPSILTIDEESRPAIYYDIKIKQKDGQEKVLTIIVRYQGE